MTTVLDLITGSLKDLGALGIGEVPTDDEAQDALEALNDMLGTWRTESMMIYANSVVTAPLVAGQEIYTLGVGGDINTTNNTHVQLVFLRDTGNNDYECYTTTDYTDYAYITSKQVTSSLPSVAYINNTFPLRTITLWPVPSDSSYTLVVWVWDKLSGFTAITDTANLPDGYNRAIRSNLAIELAPRYGKEPSAALVKTATESKAQIKRFNTDVPRLGFNKALTGQGRAWNWLTGQPS
jgi:hypothetical protein